MILSSDDLQRIMALIDEYITFYLAAVYGVSPLSTQAYTALQTYPPQTILAVAEHMVAHPDPDVRFTGARMLLHTDAQTYLPYVLRLLTDTDENVRGSFAMIVGRYKDARAVPALIDVLQRDPRANNRVKAAEALGIIGDTRAIPALRWVIENDDGEGWENCTVADTASDALTAIQSK